MKSILDSFHGILKQCPMSAEQIVEKAFGVDENGNPRKSIFTFYREINPTDAGAKLGWVDGLRIQEAAGIYAPLRLSADRLGFMLQDKREVAPDRKTWAEELAQDLKAVGLFADLMDEGATPEEVYCALQEAKRELSETARQYELDFRAGKIARRKDK